MKVVILAGGFGTRLSEETESRPKPMVEIGGKPILWHIMKIYSYYGFNDFIVLLGYKGYLIKEYFANYFLYQSDVTFDLLHNTTDVHSNSSESWKVTLVDTGIKTMTAGRMARARDYIGGESFMLTYGDGVSDVNISSLLQLHREKKAIVTMTSVQPAGRYGRVVVEPNKQISHFEEKPSGDGDWVNGGFFVCEPEVFNYIDDGQNTCFESDPLKNLAKDNKLYSYQHKGFWRCMDTLRDKNLLNTLWETDKAEWKVWE